jgi:hypothetical protein
MNGQRRSARYYRDLGARTKERGERIEAEFANMLCREIKRIIPGYGIYHVGGGSEFRKRYESELSDLNIPSTPDLISILWTPNGEPALVWFFDTSWRSFRSGQFSDYVVQASKAEKLKRRGSSFIVYKFADGTWLWVPAESCVNEKWLERGYRTEFGLQDVYHVPAELWKPIQLLFETLKSKISEMEKIYGLLKPMTMRVPTPRLPLPAGILIISKKKPRGILKFPMQARR